nr:extracellular solute-binding protein [Angustibacter aerolatus]
MRRRPLVLAVTALTALALSACGGGSSDVVGASAVTADGSGGTLNLFAYAVPKPGFDKVIPGFEATAEGKGVAFQQSYGASGDQSRKVAAGAEADVVNFSVEPDVTRLVDAGLVSKDWNTGPTKGLAFGSVVTIVVRKGNPKKILDWDDLLKPGVEVVTPNPFGSGSAKWNLLAPYAAKSDGGKNPQAGLDYVSALVGEHVKTQPASGREASETFTQGTGDALIAYENEALFLERSGEPLEHHTPPTTFKIENPVAALSKSKNAAKAKAFVDYLFTPAAQEPVGRGGLPPGRPGGVREARRRVPAADEALDDRRPRGLVDGRPVAVRQGEGLRGEDLRRGDEVT